MAIITHYVGLWPPGTRSDAEVKAGTGASYTISPDPTSNPGEQVDVQFSGVAPGSYELEWFSEDTEGTTARGVKQPLSVAQPGEQEFGFSPDNGGSITWYSLVEDVYTAAHHTYAAYNPELVATFLNREAGQTWFYDWAQLETGNFATSQIETFGATGTRNRTKLRGDINSEFSQGEVSQDWAQQWKFSLVNDISTAPTETWGIFALLAVDGTTTDYAAAYLSPTTIVFQVTVAGTDYLITFNEAGVAGILAGQEIDLRVKWTATELTAWLKYPGQALYKKTNVTATSAWPEKPMTIVALGLEDDVTSSVNDLPGALKSVRIEAPAPADVDIEAWT